MSDYVLVIDQGTTSTRAIVFNNAFQSVASAQQEFPQHFPDSGWVEHDANDLWQTTLATSRLAIERAGIEPNLIAAVGITNQRETVVIWDKRTGKPVHRAIVWQDRRTAETCASLSQAGYGDFIAQKTGLLLDPYFSASKIAWILDHVDGARADAEAGHLAFGTVESWLIYKLTNGQKHVTDTTNASRTMLCDIHKGQWDEDLLKLFNIPAAILPKILNNIDDFGVTDTQFFGSSIAIRGAAGDQQAAMIGQACFKPGMIKSTYGTGCFALLNTGTKPVRSNHRLLTTIAYSLDGTLNYALEGSIFVAGASVQWLRDGLKVIESASETAALAAQADPHQHIYLVPAFTGLGAPWWNAEARGTLFGMTRNTGAAELARAALESVCFQTKDLLDVMYQDFPHEDDVLLRVDGGMAANDWTMQRLADILDVAVDRPVSTEVTALGAAWLAGYGAGIWPDTEGFAQSWHKDRSFLPQACDASRTKLISGWSKAVKCTLAFADAE
ncbi:glycerol kinase GlpK [Brucellaceae bacterium C25G]